MKVQLILTIILTSLFACKENENTGEDGSNSQDVDTIHYQNPVFASDFPDPAVLKSPDGWYYVYATQSRVNGKTQNIQALRSKDLVNWVRIGDVLPQKPAWASTTQDFWAPHVIYDETTNKYYMYYSGKSDNPDFDKCLGVAVSDSPEGPFIDKGEPLICGEGFVNIDPFALDDPQTGKHLLYWGSGFSPIKVQELDSTRLNFKENTTPKDLIFPNADEPYSNLVEGAWVTVKDGQYYLFYSGDNCCGENAHYAVMVAKADDPFGPFKKSRAEAGKDNSVVLEKNDQWLAPGHNSVIMDSAGNYWMFYHAINRNNRSGRILLMDRITWQNGWPAIKGPSYSNMIKPE